jgi:hypothetical protein
LSNVLSLAGRFDTAALEALFVDNAAPSLFDIQAAKAEVPVIAAEAAALIYKRPNVDGFYVNKQPAFRPICRMMERMGWQFCGSGYYSAAFFKAGLTVKVGFKPEDSALLYSAWCRANKGRAGVPVIHAIKSDGAAYVVLMDRLEAIAGELTEGDSTFDPQMWAEYESVRETINLGVDGWGKHMELCQTALAIREFFEGVANFDIHESNMMLDRDGNIIITDPVCFAGDYQSFTNAADEPSRAYG